MMMNGEDASSWAALSIPFVFSFTLIAFLFFRETRRIIGS
jgi:hypothetical protein